MTRLLANRIAWLYTADAGEVYRVTAQKAVTDQGKLGGTASDGTEPPLPHGFKMRRITLHNSTLNRARAVPVYSGDAGIVAPAATVNLNSGGVVGGSYVEDSYAFANNQTTPVILIGEKHPRKSPVTGQVA